MSEAIGKLEIQANSSVEIEELKKYFKITNDWTYNISCKDLDNKKNWKSSAEEIQYDGALPLYVICNFKGTGFGSFPLTIYILQDWLNKEIIDNQLLRNSDFKIIFDYIDLSSKQNFINEEKRALVHTPDSFRLCCIYEFDHEYTLVNKADILGSHLEEVIADEFKDKSDLAIFSILYKERKQIEEYTGKLLEVYLYENGFDRYAEICSENSFAFIRPFEQNFG